MALASDIRDLIQTIQPNQSWKSVLQLEREYLNGRHGSINDWISTKKIPPEGVRKAEKRGQATYVDEYYVWAIVNRVYEPRNKPAEMRPAIIQPAAPHSRPIMLPSQVVTPAQALTQQTATSGPLPTGLRTVQDVVNQYLAMRRLDLKQGKLAKGTYHMDETYLKRFVMYGPRIYPWTPDDLDNYRIATQNMLAQPLAMARYNSLRKWLTNRYPNMGLPQAPLNQYIPKRRTPLAQELVEKVLGHMKTTHYIAYVFSYSASRIGARPWELERTRWQLMKPMGYSTAEFEIPASKKKNPGMVYLPPDILDLWRTLPTYTGPDATGPIFVTKPGNPMGAKAARDALYRSMAKFGIPQERGNYMLRHYYALQLKKAGYPNSVIAQLMRTSEKMLQTVYGFDSDEGYYAVAIKAGAAAFAPQEAR